jgi:hypothetical protein
LIAKELKTPTQEKADDPVTSYRDAILNKISQRTNHRIIDQMKKRNEDQTTEKRSEVSKSQELVKREENLENKQVHIRDKSVPPPARPEISQNFGKLSQNENRS